MILIKGSGLEFPCTIDKLPDIHGQLADHMFMYTTYKQQEHPAGLLVFTNL